MLLWGPPSRFDGAAVGNRSSSSLALMSSPDTRVLEDMKGWKRCWRSYAAMNKATDKLAYNKAHITPRCQLQTGKQRSDSQLYHPVTGQLLSPTLNSTCISMLPSTITTMTASRSFRTKSTRRQYINLRSVCEWRHVCWGGAGYEVFTFGTLSRGGTWVLHHCWRNTWVGSPHKSCGTAASSGDRVRECT